MWLAGVLSSMSTDKFTRLMLAGVTLAIAATLTIFADALTETAAVSATATTGLKAALSLLVLLAMTIGINAANHYNLDAWEGLSPRRRTLFIGVLTTASALSFGWAATLIPTTGGVFGMVRLVALIACAYAVSIFPLLRASRLGDRLEQWGRQVAAE